MGVEVWRLVVLVSGSDVLRLVGDDRADAFGVFFADMWVQSLGLSSLALTVPLFYMSTVVLRTKPPSPQSVHAFPTVGCMFVRSKNRFLGSVVVAVSVVWNTRIKGKINTWAEGIFSNASMHPFLYSARDRTQK